jgi:hypothetical protein
MGPIGNLYQAGPIGISPISKGPIGISLACMGPMADRRSYTIVAPLKYWPDLAEMSGDC